MDYFGQDKSHKLLIAGGRDFSNQALFGIKLLSYVEELPGDNGVSIITGLARGADQMAHEFCINNSVLCHEFPANWDVYGKRAGFIRNAQMGEFADSALIFWDGSSRGTKHMIGFMKDQNKPVAVVYY